MEASQTLYELNMGSAKGYPLAPMLFAMTTQPLLNFLDNERTLGRMIDIKISENLSICEHLFVDDIGILILATPQCYVEVESCIRLYELTSGAKLNISKSIVLPIGLSNIPQWLQDKGSVIISPGTILTYLGAPLGVNISPSQITDFCLDRVSKRLSTWKSRTISFTGLIILIISILLSIPVYHMMYLYFSSSASKKLQQLCKNFLWGYNKEGWRKTPLISWDRMSQHKKHGGIDLKNITTQGTALLARWASKMISNDTLEWLLLFKALVTMLKWQNSCTRKCFNYSIEDFMLFNAPKSSSPCRYTQGLWKAWQSL